MSTPAKHNPGSFGSEALVVQSDASPGLQQGTILTRTLHVNVSGTLANLAMAGPSGGMWKLVDGKGISVFGVGNEVDQQVRFICVWLLAWPISSTFICVWPLAWSDPTRRWP
jgi:hypothetical protein